MFERPRYKNENTLSVLPAWQRWKCRWKLLRWTLSTLERVTQLPLLSDVVGLFEIVNHYQSVIRRAVSFSHCLIEMVGVIRVVCLNRLLLSYYWVFDNCWIRTLPEFSVGFMASCGLGWYILSRVHKFLPSHRAETVVYFYQYLWFMHPLVAVQFLQMIWK